MPLVQGRNHSSESLSKLSRIAQLVSDRLEFGLDPLTSEPALLTTVLYTIHHWKGRLCMEFKMPF